MGDMGDDFRAWKQARIQKRADNRESSAAILREHGVVFDARNDGAHLIIRHPGKVVNFWPGTGKWNINGKYGRGVFQLLKHLQSTDR